MDAIATGLEAVPLTPEAFEPFGIAFPLDCPGSSAPLVSYERAHPGLDLPRLTTTRLEPSSLPVRIGRMEYHPYSSQTFIPLSCSRYLIAVAPRAVDGAPDLRQVRCFHGTARCGVHYAAGVWHASMVALEEPARFAVQMWRGEAVENDVFLDLAEAITCNGLRGEPGDPA